LGIGTRYPSECLITITLDLASLAHPSADGN
jgi:hypothetical protein